MSDNQQTRSNDGSSYEQKLSQSTEKKSVPAPEKTKPASTDTMTKGGK